MLKKCKGFLVGNIYRPPDGSKYLDKDFDPKLDDMLDFVVGEEKEVLLLGDLNCNYLVQNDHKDLEQIMRYNGKTNGEKPDKNYSKYRNVH